LHHGSGSDISSEYGFGSEHYAGLGNPNFFFGAQCLAAAKAVVIY
jgi:hypothetical protein